MLKMRRMFKWFICFSLVYSLNESYMTQIVSGAKPIVGGPQLAVLVNGKKVVFHGGDPISENDRVLVPLRGIGEELGAKVEFKENTILYEKEDRKIKFELGSKIASINSAMVTMESQARAIKGRIYVPLRFISEYLGENVLWDPIGNWVWVGDRVIPRLEDVVKKEPLEPYKKYFQNFDVLLKDVEGTEYSDARVITYLQLPLKINDTLTIYDIWPIKQEDVEGIQIRASFNGFTTYLLSENSQPRQRQERKGLLIKNQDGTTTSSYPIVNGNDMFNDPNYKNYKLQDVEYIYLREPVDSIVMIKCPFVYKEIIS